MQNTAEGDEALLSLNVAVGYSNTALGHQALYSDTTGADNTATGDSALFGNATGNGNTVFGSAGVEIAKLPQAVVSCPSRWNVSANCLACSG